MGPFLDAVERWNAFIDLAVALGTLALALVAFWEIRRSLQDRRRHQVREISERVYKPLLNVERPNYVGGAGAYPAYALWSKLEVDAFPATEMVPTRIRRLAGEIELAGKQLTPFVTRLSQELQPIMDSTASQLRSPAIACEGTRIRWRAGEMVGSDLNPLDLWLAGKTPLDEAQEQAGFWARDGLRLEVYDNNDPGIAWTAGATRVFQEAKTWLEASDDAQHLAQGTRKFHAMKDELKALVSAEIRILAD